MGRKKNKNATWFKINLANKDLFLALEDETLGKVLKYALNYFANGEITDIDNLNIQDKLFKLAFTPLKQSCDEAMSDYRSAVANGLKGAKNRWGDSEKTDEDSPSIDPL